MIYKVVLEAPVMPEGFRLEIEVKHNDVIATVVNMSNMAQDAQQVLQAVEKMRAETPAPQDNETQ